ncbi:MULTISPECIES: hypothetical protein [unclassified Wolbachia]|uniref:hypothetical protein n=1 Tax=unclassified Wolbachia TaxID=2640676 RepID=UPI002231F645|nr:MULTISPECIES: hypothetical protein [unclassified Wolbachia]
MEDLKVNIVFSNETLECLAKLAKKENQPIQDLAEKLMQAVVTHELSELGNLITFSHETSVWLMGIARLKNQPVQDLTEKLMQEAIEAYEDIAQQQSNALDLPPLGLACAMSTAIRSKKT